MNLNEVYFKSLVQRALWEAAKASSKFPQPNYVLLKVAEEAGEVVKAGVHYIEGREPWTEVEGEMVQLLAMMIRLVSEGDQVNGLQPPAGIRSYYSKNSTITVVHDGIEFHTSRVSLNNPNISPDSVIGFYVDNSGYIRHVVNNSVYGTAIRNLLP